MCLTNETSISWWRRYSQWHGYFHQNVFFLLSSMFSVFCSFWAFLEHENILYFTSTVGGTVAHGKMELFHQVCAAGDTNLLFARTPTRTLPSNLFITLFLIARLSARSSSILVVHLDPRPLHFSFHLSLLQVHVFLYLVQELLFLTLI